ncbi:MAG: PhzF family phenazine biosynthesis protein [Actinomycetia bacterium]|nr:PhzF family phenazine biosynthesis protein [Actinomycetes bacterium]
MAEPLTYHVVDVFTDRPFAGNPLAVVLGADDVPTAGLQALAREFHLSETAFPLPPSAAERAAGADYRVRIFTPEVELPFAGHPSVGTAWLLAHLGRLPAGQVRQACGAGVVTLEVAAGGGPVELTGAAPTCGHPVDPAPLLAAVGLEPADLAGPRPRVAGTGIGFAHLAVRPGSLARCAPDPGLLRAFSHPAGAATGVYVVEWPAAGHPVRARMFAGDVGVPEDPATGSAALGLAVWAVAEGLVAADGESAFTVVQGVELGRPSTLRCRVDAVGGAAVRARVAGGVVPVAQGRIAVPPAPAG